MESHANSRFYKWLVLPALLAMLAVNALSAMLPLNGVTPGEASARYPNLFVPAPYVFSIWGAIYLLVIGYTLYTLGLFRKKGEPADESLLRKTAYYFIATCALNVAWLFAWHYGQMILSLCVIVLFLLTLILLRRFLAASTLSRREKLFLQLPFSVYFGWITVATIANATALLVAFGFSGLGIPEAAWTMIVLAVGAVIAMITALRFYDAAYLAVFLWAYAGILQNHLSASGFGGAYPGVIGMACLCLATFAAAFVVLLIRRKPLLAELPQ